MATCLHCSVALLGHLPSHENHIRLVYLGKALLLDREGRGESMALSCSVIQSISACVISSHPRRLKVGLPPCAFLLRGMKLMVNRLPMSVSKIPPQKNRGRSSCCRKRMPTQASACWTRPCSRTMSAPQTGTRRQVRRYTTGRLEWSAVILPCAMPCSR